VKTGASKVKDFAPVPDTDVTVTRGQPSPPDVGLEQSKEVFATQYVEVQSAEAIDAVEEVATVAKFRPFIVTTTPPEPAAFKALRYDNTGAS
jgi:hypothetical protein